MKDFLDKWNSDSKFKAKIKLGLYTLFVVIVSIFTLSARGNIEATNTLENNNDINQNEQEASLIEIPDKYNYKINITINDKSYQYNGTKETAKETITKISNNVTKNYIYQDGSYYQEDNGNYILSSKEEVYDVVSYNYLNLDTINQYLSKAKKENETYKVYLKDIILGNDSEEYITITIKANKVNIDYTSLMKLFDQYVEKYMVEIVIEEIE